MEAKINDDISRVNALEVPDYIIFIVLIVPYLNVNQEISIYFRDPSIARTSLGSFLTFYFN